MNKLMWFIGLTVFFIFTPQVFAQKPTTCTEALSEIKVSSSIRSAIVKKMNVFGAPEFTAKDIKNLVVLEQSKQNMRIYFLDRKQVGYILNILFSTEGKTEKIIFEEMLGSHWATDVLARVSDQFYVPTYILGPLLQTVGFKPKDIQDIIVLEKMARKMKIYIENQSGAFIVIVQLDSLFRVDQVKPMEWIPFAQ